MIPKDHGFGTSFKGVGQYLLHDKGHANTNERVTWTHTEGFGTSDAETAFRIMAAVAMDADRLKRQAHRSEEHTSELQSLTNLVCRLLLEKKKKNKCTRVSLQSHNFCITFLLQFH